MVDAGAATGVVDAPLQLGADRVRGGDLIIAMPASGFHANGYSLIRHILATQKLDLSKTYEGLSILSLSLSLFITFKTGGILCVSVDLHSSNY